MVGKPASPSMHTADGRSQRLLPLQVVLSAALQRMYGSATYGHGPTLQDPPRGRPGRAERQEVGPVVDRQNPDTGPCEYGWAESQSMEVVEERLKAVVYAKNPWLKVLERVSVTANQESSSSP